ncbi:hypothetical protein Syun_014173 [Stephania yunnanensis]|uniref:Uncharacterized protein n=1 Tax=Stephania yunnanensis TaxID=152371 RepID=A0AAP0P8C2_9MAGN
MKVAVNTLFAGERFLCDFVFSVGFGDLGGTATSSSPWDLGILVGGVGGGTHQISRFDERLGYLHDYMTQSFNAVETTLRNHSDRLRRIESQRLPARPARDDHASSSDHPPPSSRRSV